jgi:acyl-CoA reductase-like NAD-dependent aldehyde dehydrogenase
MSRMVFPRKCSGCGTLTAEDGLARDRSQPSGRKSRCRVCHRRDVKVYHDAVRKPRRLAALEAERAAEWKALEAEHRERAKAVKRAAAAGAKRQREFLASIGVEDVSGEELSRRVRAAGGHYVCPRAQEGRPLAYREEAA